MVEPAPVERRQPRGRLPTWVLGSINLVVVLAVYFAVPVHAGQGTARVVGGLVLTLLGVLAAAFIVAREARRRHVGAQGALTGLRLLLLLEVVMVLFALAYYHLAVDSTGQIHGIHTRIDALYFTVTVMTTVGFGDIHPVGQAARALVAAHMVFDVGFIAAFAGLFRQSLDGRGRREDR